jgi:hypothetical protein
MKYIQESECEQFHEAQNIDTDTKTIQDMFKILHEKMSEMLADNPNLQINLEKKFSEMNISEINQELKDCVTEMREEKKNPELNDKFEKSADKEEGEVNNMIPIVQVKDGNYTEENLKRQGEKAAQLNVKRKYIHGELLEELEMTQVKGVTLIQDKTSNSQISPAEADHGIVIKSTDENTLNCKTIYLFTKYGYACSSRTVRLLTGF